MRYLKASLAGLAGAFVLGAAVAGIDGAIFARRLAECGDDDYACGGAVQFGGWELLVAVVVGFAVAFVWFMRRPPLAGE